MIYLTLLAISNVGFNHLVKMLSGFFIVLSLFPSLQQINKLWGDIWIPCKFLTSHKILYSPSRGNWSLLFIVVVWKFSNFITYWTLSFCVASLWLSSKESAWNAGDMGLIPGSGRSPRKEMAFQYSCLNRGAWQATVHGVTKSQTWLSD